jgi:hypothetical protein
MFGEAVLAAGAQWPAFRIFSARGKGLNDLFRQAEERSQKIEDSVRCPVLR